MTKQTAQTQTTLQPNATVSTTMVTQSAAPELDMPEKQLYYLVIKTDKGTHKLNVGEKTYKTIKEIMS